MGISDVIGVLLIVAPLAVVLWRIFEMKQIGITNAIKWTMTCD